MSKPIQRYMATMTDEQRSAMRELKTIAQERLERNEKLHAAKEHYDTTYRALNYAETQLHCAVGVDKESDRRRASGARLRHDEARVTFDALSAHFAKLEMEAQARERELYRIVPTKAKNAVDNGYSVRR